MKNFLSKQYANTAQTPMMKMAALAAITEGVIDLTIGEPDQPTPHEVCRALADSAFRGETHYTMGKGLMQLRTAVSDYWSRKYGVKYGTDDIIVTTGGVGALSLLMHVIAEQGDEVIVLEPYFTFYEHHVRQAGGSPVFCLCGPENDFAPDAAELESLITPRTKAILINSPCNPSGAVFSRGTLNKIARLAEKYDLLIVSDELYEAFAYDAPHIHFASLPGMKDRTVTIGGLSKSYAMTGWRIGYAMGPACITTAMQAAGTAQVLAVNTMAQHAAAFAIGNCGAFAEKMSAIFKDRVEYASKLFSFLPGLKCFKPKGGFYLFIDVSGTGTDGEKFAETMLREARVVTIPGVSFGSRCGRYIRIACTVPNELMKEASDRISAVLSGK